MRLIPKPKSTLGSIVELAVIIAIALGLALLIQAFIVKPYRIPSGSMEPTLAVGQRVLGNVHMVCALDAHRGRGLGPIPVS